jgi:hypothetical protein
MHTNSCNSHLHTYQLHVINKLKENTNQFFRLSHGATPTYYKQILKFPTLPQYHWQKNEQNLGEHNLLFSFLYDLQLRHNLTWQYNFSCCHTQFPISQQPTNTQVRYRQPKSLAFLRYNIYIYIYIYIYMCVCVCVNNVLQSFLRYNIYMYIYNVLHSLYIISVLIYLFLTLYSQLEHNWQYNYTVGLWSTGCSLKMVYEKPTHVELTIYLHNF